jgi:hypothetical protein
MKKALCLLLLPMAMLAADRYRMEYIVFKWKTNGMMDRFQSIEHMMEPRLTPISNLINISPKPLDTLAHAKQKLAHDRDIQIVLHGSYVIDLSQKYPRTIYIDGRYQGQTDLNEHAHGVLEFSKKQYLEAKLDIHLGAHRLMEIRRMRSHQINYFDHPAMGVLLSAEPFNTINPRVMSDSE